MAWRVRRKARPVGPRRPSLDSARPQRPKSAVVAPWVDLGCCAGQTACTDLMETIVREGEGGARAGRQTRGVFHVSWGWSLGRGEGRLEVPFGRFLEAIMTLDLALDLGAQGDWLCHLGRLVAKFKIKPRSRRSEPASQGRARWSSRPYVTLVLDVGVTEDLSRRATGLRLVSW